MHFIYLVPVKKILQQEGEKCGNVPFGGPDYGECADGLTCSPGMSPSMNEGVCTRLNQKVANKGNRMSLCIDVHKQYCLDKYLFLT